MVACAVIHEGNRQKRAVAATVVSLTRDERDRRDKGLVYLVYLVYLVCLVCPVEPRVRASKYGDARQAERAASA